MKAPRLILSGSLPYEWGRQHGTFFKEHIAELYAIRLELTFDKTNYTNEQSILAVAEQHTPILKDFNADLFEEVRGIADASGLSIAQIVLLNHYTDLRDLNRKLPTHVDDPGGCTAFYGHSDRHHLLGQTWDMHSSAEDFVCYIYVPKTETTPAMWLFSITGCVGMTGLNQHGVGMTINNLNSLDAKVGIVWPALVRDCLRHRTAQAAHERLMSAPIGSGHHYNIADQEHMFGTETSGEQRLVIQTKDSGSTHIHTNHCLSPELDGTAWVPATSTTHRRYAAIHENIEENGVPTTARDLYRSFQSVNLKRAHDKPKSVSTCGAWIMDLDRKHILARKGEPTLGEPELLAFDESD